MFDRLSTFFPFTAEGAGVLFEAVALRSDADAIGHAGRLLQEEPSAVEVVVYDGEREVSHELRLQLVRPARRGRAAPRRAI